jgi:outer membrane protein assembly factor BamE (lipoprotein component of BamABCDE complex)
MSVRSMRSLCLAATAAVALLSACAPTIRIHGFVPPESDVARITPGFDSIATVEEVLGRPASRALLGDSAWFYIQSTVENYTYNPPRVIDRTVLAVTFDENGIVQDIARYGLEDGRIVNLTTRTTETGGRTLGVLEQIFGNLLNLDAGQFEN